jgi:uncharacterized protein (DUF4415 family)
LRCQFYAQNPPPTQKKPRKVAISLRVNAETLAAYKATGKGYQTRMAAVLDKHAR